MNASQFHMAFLPPSGYDKSLSYGFNRSGNILQRPQFIIFDGQLLEPIHIRYPLQELRWGKSLRKVLRTAKEKFQSVVKSTNAVDPDMQSLYEENLPRFKGTFSKALQDIVFGSTGRNDAGTLEFSVYDGDHLVAASYMDRGQKSVCSIICVHNIQYAKFSPGILTVLLEMEYAKETGYDYYYPGYIFHEPTSFDYKTRFGDYEYMNRIDHWKKGPYTYRAGKLARQIKKRTIDLHHQLLQLGIRNKIRFYTPHFAGGIDFANLGLCGFPMMLELLDHPMRFAVWDHQRNNAYVYLMRPDPLVPNPTANMTSDYADNPIYYHTFLFKQYAIDLALFLEDPRHRMDVVKALAVERSYFHVLQRLSEIPF